MSTNKDKYINIFNLEVLTNKTTFVKNIQCFILMYKRTKAPYSATFILRMKFRSEAGRGRSRVVVR